MKLMLTAAACVIVASLVTLAMQVDSRERRITQLECALAQAYAEADTLEAALAKAEE